MNGPLYPLGAFGQEAGFIIIFFVGLAFGFFLERAGFGSARKLTAIFYFRDFAVLRVMFTAIVVALLGLVFFSSLGWIDMEGVSVPPTFLGAQAAGGLLLGIGFVVGGYCPGTSVVAAASGKLDALPYIAGLLAGNAMFGFGYDWLKPLYMSGARGVVTLSDWSGLNPGVLAFLIVAVALSAFAATEWADRRKGRPADVPAAGGGILIRVTWQRAGAFGAVLLALVLMAGRSMAGANQPRAAVHPQPASRAAVPAKLPAVQQQVSPETPALAPPSGIKKFKKGASCS